MMKLVVRHDVQTEKAVNVPWTIASEYHGAGSPICIYHFVAIIPMPAVTTWLSNGTTH